MQLIINNVEVNLVSKDGFAFANSMDVARVFEKRHDNVIQAINNFSDRVLLNFKAKGSIKKTKQKKMLDDVRFEVVDVDTEIIDMYEMNRDGFIFLVMGFTGEKADNFKLDFIDGFNKLENEVRKLQNPQTQQIQFLQGMLDTIGIMDDRVTTLEQSRRLENWQEKELQDLKNKKVYALAEKHGFSNDNEMIRKLHSRVWKRLKNVFNVPRYNEIPCIKFAEAKECINCISFNDLV